MRVVIGATLLVGFIGGVLLIISAEHLRSAWTWATVLDWGEFTVNLPLNVALIALIALFVLGYPWRAEMDAFRPAWIGLTAAALALIASAGVWFSFGLFVVNLFRTRTVEPSSFALGASLVWFAAGTLFWAWIVWDHRRARVEVALERRAPTTPGVRAFAGHIVAAPGTAGQRDPLDGSSCVSWTADGTREDIWDEGQIMVDEKTNGTKWERVTVWTQQRETKNFDSAVSEFYILVGETYIYVRPEGVMMWGRVGARVTADRLRHVDSTLAEKVNQKDLLYVRTRVLRPGDAVVGSGVVVADAEGRLALQAKPYGRWSGALVPRASVRLVGRMPRDRRHRKSLALPA